MMPMGVTVGPLVGLRSVRRVIRRGEVACDRISARKEEEMRKWLGLIGSLAVLMMSAGKSYGEPLRLVTLDYPPYEFVRGGEVRGIAVDIVREVFRRMGRSIEIRLLPWATALEEVESGRADGIFTAFRTPEREAFLEYSGEVLVPQEIALYVRFDSPIVYRGELAELGPYLIGAVDRVSYGKRFDAAVRKENGPRLKRLADSRQTFVKLLEGDVDMVVSNRFGAREILAGLGKSREVRMLGPTIESLPSYLAFSRKRMLSEVRAEFDLVLAEMKRDGTFERTIEESFARNRQSREDRPSPRIGHATDR